MYSYIKGKHRLRLSQSGCELLRLRPRLVEPKLPHLHLKSRDKDAIGAFFSTLHRNCETRNIPSFSG